MTRENFKTDKEYLEWLRKRQQEGGRKGGQAKNKNKGFGKTKRKVAK